MKIAIGHVMLSDVLTAEVPRAVRVKNDGGCNVWIGSTCITGSASVWRALADLALEAARIEEDCERAKGMT